MYVYTMGFINTKITPYQREELIKGKIENPLCLNQLFLVLEQLIIKEMIYVNCRLLSPVFRTGTLFGTSIQYSNMR